MIKLTPHITEKSSFLSSGEEGKVYVFKIDKNVNKSEVAKAVKAEYKVTPERVNIVRLPGKNIFVRGKVGRRAGLKKALVFLKKGDKIEFA